MESQLFIQSLLSVGGSISNLYMASIKINKHFFHGFYSNFGYKPSSSNFTHQRRFADYPIHVNRAIAGEKESRNSEAPKEFSSQEEVIKWYKKNKYGDSNFEKLNFPEDFCKNYFIISENDFYKYRQLFHGMIKGVKINSEIDINLEGNDYIAECPICKKDYRDGEASPGDTAGPITFTSPNGAPSYYSVVGEADDIGFLNGSRITEGDSATSFFLEGGPQSSLSFTAQDTQGGNVRIEATVTWYKEIDFKQTIKYKKEFISPKIFEISELEKRLPATNIDYRTSINIEEDVDKEELVSEFNKKVFKDNWVFDSDQFNSIFQFQANKFNSNATYINDPVIIRPGTSPLLSTKNNNKFTSFGTPSTEIVNKQKKFEKKFNKFGELILNIENDNSIVSTTEENLNFSIGGVFYIKSEKIYMCFIELENRITFDGTVTGEREECGDLECEDLSPDTDPDDTEPTPYSLALNSLVSTNINNILNIDNLTEFLSFSPASVDIIGLNQTNLIDVEYILSTDDTIRMEPFLEVKSSDCQEDSKKIEFNFSKAKIKFLDKTFEFQINKLKDEEFTFDNNSCQGLTPAFKKNIKRKIRFDLKKIECEILEWKDQDFQVQNVFPPKK